MQSDGNLTNQGPIELNAVVPVGDRTPVDTEALSELTWAVLDGAATEDDLRKLEQTLLNSKVAREDFLKMTQLHADLTLHFQGPPEMEDLQKLVRKGKSN